MVQTRAIGKADFLQRVGAFAAVLVITGHGQLVARAIDAQDQVVAAPRHGHVRAHDARAQLHHVARRFARVKIDNDVLPAAAPEHIGVVAQTAKQDVVAGVAFYAVVARIANAVDVGRAGEHQVFHVGFQRVRDA